jgi:hypothetical protein
MNVDSDSCSDIGYETDLTVVDADTDTDEDDAGDKDHDTSDFAELFTDIEHSLNYPTRFPSDPTKSPTTMDNKVDDMEKRDEFAMKEIIFNVTIRAQRIRIPMAENGLTTKLL